MFNLHNWRIFLRPFITSPSATIEDSGQAVVSPTVWKVKFYHCPHLSVVGLYRPNCMNELQNCIVVVPPQCIGSTVLSLYHTLVYHFFCIGTIP